jgi:hypothetical protein
MFTPDPKFSHPRSRIQGQNFPDPGFESASKKLSILTQKLFLISQKYDPGCSSRIRILIFTHPGSPDPVPQHCFVNFLLSLLRYPYLASGKNCPCEEYERSMLMLLSNQIFQMKYLYLVCIVLNHFIFSSMMTLYALLVYCSLCEPNNAEDNRVNRWNFFTSQVGFLS